MDPEAAGPREERVAPERLPCPLKLPEAAVRNAFMGGFSAPGSVERPTSPSALVDA